MGVAHMAEFVCLFIQKFHPWEKISVSYVHRKRILLYQHLVISRNEQHSGTPYINIKVVGN